jgi:ribonuclease HII
MDRFEQRCWNINQVCLGLDEAGRGSLAGPVTVGGVVLPKGYSNHLIRDSKQCSADVREQAFQTILNHALFVTCMFGSVSLIEHLNILGATLHCMQNIVTTACAEFSSECTVLIDGPHAPAQLDNRPNVHRIVKGDSQSISIAAASIVAKVCRDRYMSELHTSYPLYMFDKHKGYGTLQHRNIVLQHGACKHHRKLFIRKLAV